MEATHHPIWAFQALKNLLKSFCLSAWSSSAVFLGMSSTDWKWVPLSELFNFGKRKESHGARGGECGMCLSIGIIYFATKNWRILWDHFGTHFFSCSHRSYCLSIFNSYAVILMPKWLSVLTRALIFFTSSTVLL